MKFLLTILLLQVPAISPGEDLPPLSPVEARMQVENQKAAREIRKASKLSNLLAVAALTENEQTVSSGQKILMRQVIPPPQSAAPPKNASKLRSEFSEKEFRKPFSEAKPPENLSLSVTVYDKQFSEIRIWHDGTVYRALSNVGFSYLQAMGSFEDEVACWSLFCLVDEIDTEKEKQLVSKYQNHGATYSPRQTPDTSLFTSLSEPEYLVFQEADQTIPDGVLTKLDSLHAHYLANEETLAIKHQRREALAEAHRQYRKENPEEPEDIVINFWRESEKTP